MASNTAVQAKMNDLLMVDSADEAHIVQEIVQRYRQGYVYTFLGPVLIAMNPYRQLTNKDGTSIYDMSLVKEFSGKELHLCDPHPFAIAEAAYTNLMRFNNDQSILITGESGSGKTETSKHVMQYLTTISTRSRARSAVMANRRLSVAQRQEVDDLISRVTEVLWGSNPVLEAFGNAQTIRNNNSSRFGKYIVLQMNRIGQVTGGYIDNYLLERSRVIQQSDGERSFHIFYQLLAGATDKQREEFDLLPADEYSFLSNGEVTIDGMDDAAQFKHTMEKMSAVGVTKEEQHQIFQLLAAVLWTGNIQFTETTDEAHNKIAKLDGQDSRKALQNVARLLGIEEQRLENMVSYRTLNIYRSDQQLLFDARQARKVCDSIARSTYEKLFNWLVGRINENVHVDPKHVSNSVGILDIYGFEIFEVNQFEQLCINYVNEKLQQLFISQTLEREQEEYKKEGLKWDGVSYSNNQVVCDLIENQKTHGLFPLLDEQCAISRLDTLELIERYNAAHNKNPAYVASRIQGPNFSVKHYAGEVEYDVTLFFEANVDTFFNEMHEAMEGSTVPFVRDIFVDERTDAEKKKRPPSTSQQFRSHVASLLKNLEGCNPNYIRCVKPNEKKQPLAVSEKLVTEQVHYLGLVEHLHVRRQGFCYSETYANFLKRYKFLSPRTWPDCKEHSSRKAAVELLTDPNLGIPEIDSPALIPFEEDSNTLGCFALGRSKIFLKHPQALSALEMARERNLPVMVALLENTWRRYKNRQALKLFKSASAELFTAHEKLMANCLERRKRRVEDKERKTVLYLHWNDLSSKLLKDESRLAAQLQERERENLVIFTQSFARMQIARRRLLKMKDAQRMVSKVYRGVHTRQQMPPKLYEACKQVLLGIRTDFEKFMGEKKRRRDSLDRPWTQDYIGVKQLPAYSTLLKNRKEKHVRFVAQVDKVNERFVHQSRVLLVSDRYLFNLKAEPLQKPKERRVVDLTTLSGVVMSTLPDDYVLLRVKNESDLLCSCAQKTEFVSVLRERVETLSGRQLPVEFLSESEFYGVKGKPLMLKFEAQSTEQKVECVKQDKKTMVVRVPVSL